MLCLIIQYINIIWIQKGWCISNLRVWSMELKDTLGAFLRVLTCVHDSEGPSTRATLLATAGTPDSFSADP